MPFDPNSSTVSSEEYRTYVRFDTEQYDSLVLQVNGLIAAVKNTQPDATVHPKVRELLTKQVERLTKQIDGFNIRILGIERKLGHTEK